MYLEERIAQLERRIEHLEHRLKVEGVSRLTHTLAEKLVNAAADHFMIHPSQIMGRCRQQPIVNARHIVWWFCLKRVGWSCHYIATLFKCDHSGVNYGVHRIDNLVATDKGFSLLVHRAEDALQAAMATDHEFPRGTGKQQQTHASLAGAGQCCGELTQRQL